MEDYLFYALIIGVAGVASFKMWRGVELLVAWIPIPHSIATLTDVGLKLSLFVVFLLGFRNT